MKKIILFAVISCFLAACGKGKSPESMAKTVCDCNKKLAKMGTADPKYADEQRACFDKQLSAREAFEKDEAKMKEFNRLMNECAAELMPQE